MDAVRATRVAGDEFTNLKKPGDFRWTFRNSGAPSKLLFVCPCGCGRYAGVNVHESESPCWGFNGNLDEPTITPSIDINAGHWHGHLIGGQFISV